MIDQRISKSDKLASLKTDRARVLYFMIYPHTDCEGRFSGDPRDIKEDCCPRLQYSIKKIAEAIIDLDHVGLLNLYEAKGLPCLEFTRFDDFQKIRKEREAESKIPAYSGLTPEDSRRTPLLYLSLSLSLSSRKLKEEGSKTTTTKITYDFASRKFLNITPEIKKKWQEAYPAVDIDAFIRHMEVWQFSNPSKRKSDYERAFCNWLKREQDRGGTIRQSKQGAPLGTWLQKRKGEEIPK